MKNKLLVVLSSFVFISVFFACSKDTEVDQALMERTQLENVQHTDEQRSCGSEEHMQLLLQDPAYQAAHTKKFERLSQMTATRSMSCDNPIVIPVAIHYQGVSNPDAACLRSLAQSQIDILNADYRGQNDDISNWTDNASSYFPGISNGDACVTFCIANKNHPSGYNLNNGDLAVTINQTNGDNVNAWSGYINIFVRPNLGYLGYSPLGGSGNGDGVVVDAGAFGSGSGCTGVSPQSPYDLGRTLTHELGHYLLLDHIWGNGGCNSDDEVADTPNASQENYGCPNLGISSCSSNDMHMNYMDYTNDACMYMFSAGQATRMGNYLNSSLQNVINNASNVCDDEDNGGGGENEATCTDGIQNGDETGVDCGGSNCAPCETTVGCGFPENITATVLSPVKVRINWTKVIEGEKYRVRYRPQGTTQWVTKGTKKAFRALIDLQPNTTYEYRLRTICTDDRSDWSPIQTFTTSDDGNGGGGDNDCDGTSVGFQLTLDDYGSETTWALLNANWNILESGGPYNDGQNGQTINENFCLPNGCYSIEVDDAYGDGICCDYGDGSFQLLNADGSIAGASDGYFGYFDYIDFCVNNGNIVDVSYRSSAKTKGKGGKVKKPIAQ